MNVAQSEAGRQFEALKKVPSTIYTNWPAVFTFPIMELVEGVIFQAIPNVGGYAGLIVNSALRGTAQVARMALWDAIKSEPIVKKS